VEVAVPERLIGADRSEHLDDAEWEVDRSAAHFGWFEHVPFILSLVLAYAALRVGDASLRAKLAIGVIAAFSVAAAVMLGLSLPSLAFLGLALAVGYLEWPVEAPEARAY